MKRLFPIIAACAALFGTGSAFASVILHGTRVVYPGQARDVTIAAENNGDLPVLVQAWLDTGESSARPEDSKTPFVLTPPLFRLDPKKTQSLRIIKSGDTLPKDKESLFWLNVLEIPPQTDDGGANNKLRLVFRTRVKLFFRPPSLDGKVEDAAGRVSWRVTRDAKGAPALLAHNPTPYHVTFSRVATTVDGVRYDVPAGGMVDPGADLTLALTAAPAGNPAASGVVYAYINDYGVSVDGRATLSLSD